METNDYKELFLTEAREYLSTLNNALVVLEKDPVQSESIHEIFRAAHTLKGMSATMGYEPMAQLTHQMEAVLEPIRSGSKLLTAPLVDALFACLDKLGQWVRALTRQDFVESDGLDSLVKRLKDQGGLTPETESAPKDTDDFPDFLESEKEVMAQAKMNGFSVLRIAVELTPDCTFKEVRAFMILKKVNEMGEILKTSPVPEEIEKGLFARGFQLVVVTDALPEKWRESLSQVGEVASVQAEPVREKGGPETLTTERAHGKQDSPAPARVEEKAFTLPTVRVHTSKLDKLMALVQELVISKIRFEQVARTKEVKELSDPLSQLNHITDELQNEIMKVRMMSVKQIFDRFPRMVRDLARSLGKQVDLEMEGAEVELDRTVIEEMSEPLVHLIRNAIDHGFESPEEREGEGKESFGTLRLQAKRERSYVVLSVVDDGRGIDPEVVRQKSVAKGLITPEEAAKLTDEEAVRLVALPGFSTVEKANEVSGRGVGVDVAKTKVEALGGTFRILSRKGHGTTFILRFPLTLAIIKALLVRCNKQVFAIPVVTVAETVDVYPTEKKKIQQQETILLRGEVIPVYRLQELLELDGPSEPEDPNEPESVLIVEVGDARVGLWVDSVIAQQEIAIKPLEKLLKGIRGFSGATILGNGKIALILDVNSLIEDLKDKRFQDEHSLLDKDDTHVAQSR